jgi:hypothetical protein
MTPLVLAWPNVAHTFHVDGGIRARFFYPRYTFGLGVSHDAWPFSLGLRDVVPAIRSLLDEVFLSHKHLLRLYASLACQPRIPGLAGNYFFFLGVWARSEAIGPRSLGGVFGFRRSLPACDAVRFEVAMQTQYDPSCYLSIYVEYY